MGMSRCYAVMKCLLILLNIVFLMVGVGVSVFCAWALLEGGAGEEGARAGVALLALWALALALAALAALAGACRGSPSLLAAAFALLALTAVAEGAAAWWGATHAPALRRQLELRLAAAVRHYGSAPAASQLVDAAQLGLACCGAASPRDWAASEWRPAALDLSVGAAAAAAHYELPPSCCRAPGSAACEKARRVPAAGGPARAQEALHAAGCSARVLAQLRSYARVPLAAAAALLAAHALALLLALALCLRAPHERPRYKA